MSVFADTGDAQVAHILDFTDPRVMADHHNFVEDAAFDHRTRLDIGVRQHNRLAYDSIRPDVYPWGQNRIFDQRPVGDHRTIGNQAVFDGRAGLNMDGRTFFAQRMDNPGAV